MLRTCIKAGLLWIALSLLQTAGTSAAYAQAGGKSNPGVIPVTSHYRGLTYGEWSARWWQWAFSLPVDHHPLYDTADCSAGQSGDVWFLGATFAPTEILPGQFAAIADRACVIPSSTALFFPIANSEASVAEGNGSTDAELRAAVAGFQDFAMSLSATVDGRSIQDLDRYRVQSPLYTFGPLPDNNILQSFGLNAPAGTSSLSVADGVFLMVAPLSVGQHTIHFHADFPDFNNFLLDITYHITVVPRGR